MTDTELAERPAPRETGMMAVAQSRAAQEVQAAMLVAKNFPRDEDEAYARIMRAFARPKMAEEALYSFPKGDGNVDGLTIRAAEVMAQNWGNMNCGIMVLDRQKGTSKLMAYSWDLETNTRFDRVFDVPHEIGLRGGGTKRLTDERDIYEIEANKGSRRLRACILATVPKWVQDECIGKVNETLAGDHTEPLKDRVRRILSDYEEIGVTLDRIEARLGHKVEAVDEVKFVGLRKVFLAISDGMTTADKQFPRVTAKTDAAPASLDGIADALEKKVTPATVQDAEEKPNPDESVRGGTGDEGQVSGPPATPPPPPDAVSDIDPSRPEDMTPEQREFFGVGE